MNIQQINNALSITDYLASQGIQPVRRKGGDWWYVSPIRPAEYSPSFKVSTKLNRWYDHGTGEGGKVFDLALRLHPTGTIQETIKSLFSQFFLSQANDVPGLKQGERHPAKVSQNRAHAPEPGITVLDVQELGQSSHLTCYLRKRGIRLSTAKPYCKEVKFVIEGREYQAIGFGNRSGGYELRSAWFKGSSSPKDITFVDNGSGTVCLLEGFMDFLSLLELKSQHPDKSNFLVLNSASLTDRSLGLLRQHQGVYFFLDRDQAGRRVAESLQCSGVEGIDCSAFYNGHKDVNEYLAARRNRARRHRRRPGHL
ncbi:toprim domain-containing protein [Pontibacter pamirensis]|uniref:toprim domain-containing protein n=1 Tax=Pontibacter pamirensis TaxID=2562824 RepID=UPI00138989EC|nr:toprim domain-containing protein [Pontibacter pamirensis]